MKSNIDVLRPSVMNLVLGQMNSTLAITMYIDILLNHPQITDQTLKPQCLIDCLCSCNILCFP